MTELKQELSKINGKIHLAVWTVFWIVTACIFFVHSAEVLGDKTNRPFWVWILYIGMIAILALSIIFCIRSWLFKKVQTDEKGRNVKGKFKPYHFTFFVIIAIICFLIMELINNSEKLLEMNPLYMAMNILGCFIMMLIMMAWLNSFKRTIIMIVAFTTTMSLIFYYVYLCRGEPLQFIDIFSFSTAMEVAGAYSFKFTRWVTIMLTAALCLLAIIMHIKKDYQWAGKLKTKLLSRAAAIVSMAVLFQLYLNVNWNGALGIVTDLWAPHDTYEEVGTNMGFFCVAKFMRNTPPDGYSVEKASEVAEQSREDFENSNYTAKNVTTKPVNIIAIMNEAWADYSVFDKFKTNESYQPFYYSMTENTIKGHTLVCISGGGTAKTEYEFLTGNSVKQYPGMVPYVSYYTHDQYSLVSTLKAQGYETAAMHPNKGTNWNRTTAYRFLGFDNFYTIDDFSSSAEKYRNMITDMENYKKIIEVIESKDDPSQPFFLFNVTMQDHGGYGTDNFPTDIQVEGYDDSAWNRYLSLVKKSDEALQYLIEYFENCDEPTMIVMFGDHFPSQDSKVEEYLSGKKRDELDIEEMEDYYQTPFFIWTNYDMESEQDVVTSTNYLGTLMMEQTGLEMTDYEHYQIMLMNKMKAFNHKGYVDADGGYHFWKDASKDVTDSELEYEYLQYNNLVESGNRLDSFFTIQEDN